MKKLFDYMPEWDGGDVRATPKGKLYFKGGGGGGSTTSTNTTQNYSPEEAARRTQVMDEAKRIYDATSGTISGSPYPGPQVVGFSPETQVAQNLAVNNAAAAQDSINSINQGVKYGLSGAMDVDNNPYLRQAIDAALRTTTDAYTGPGGVLSNIRTGAEASGQYGGSRQGIAEGIAAGKYNQAINDTAAKMASDAYNKGQDTFSRTLMFAPQALETGMMPVNWLSGVGAQKEALGQEQAAYNANAKMWELNAPWAPLQNYASIVYGGATPSTTTTGTGTTSGGGSRNALGGALGGAMSGFQAFGPWGALGGGILGGLLG